MLYTSAEVEQIVQERVASLQQELSKLKKADNEHKRMKEALHEKAEENHSLMVQPPQTLVILQDGRIVFANLWAEEYGGYPEEELLAMSDEEVLQLFHPEDRPMITRCIRERLVGTEEPVRREVRFIRRDGKMLWGDVFVNLVQYKGREAYQILFVDITERKRVEEALGEYAENLRRRNEDLDRYAYVASHDLKEPLRAIVSFSQILQQEYTGRLDADADRYLSNIIEAGNRMNTLINDLLEFSRITIVRTEYHSVDATVVVKDALSLLQAEINEHGATIAYGPLPMVRADPNQLQQVFLNLISNAIKFRKPEISPKIHISAQKMDNMVQFTVQDNGIGIEPEYYDRIFMIFERLHGREKYPGTGIGLAIVKRIIDQHGG
ncbi:MAG TPA: ATP-binding protein, partial [Methanomicrobiales archaeon]|nr:ATP-binding protein [Methanomicrobiales archaeon]